MLCRKMPGDLFQFKLMKKNTAFILDQFDRRISDHTPTSPGGKHKAFVDAYLAKMEEEDNEGTTFTCRYKQESPPVGNHKMHTAHCVTSSRSSTLGDGTPCSGQGWEELLCPGWGRDSSCPNWGYPLSLS